VKRFEINIGKGYGPVSSELAINGNVFMEVKDLTGAVSCVHCGAISEIIEILLLHTFMDYNNVCRSYVCAIAINF